MNREATSPVERPSSCSAGRRLAGPDRPPSWTPPPFQRDDASSLRRKSLSNTCIIVWHRDCFIRSPHDQHHGTRGQSMMITAMTRASVVAALLGAFLATDALAQGKGNKDKSNDRNRAGATDSRSGADRPELIRRGDVWEVQQRRGDDRRGTVNTGPPFCQNGAGHPVHGRRWCEDRGFGVYRSDRHDRNDSRSTDRTRRGATNYETAHLEFHRQHDRECRARANERPLDVQHQLRVRNECRQRHNEWHARAGRAH
jgi:hypothetical protein